MRCTGQLDCQNEAKPERHPCPYAEEIEDNYDDEFCDCCDDCTQECADDI